MANQNPASQSPVVPPLLTAAQVATLLQVSLRTIRRQIKAGLLPVVRFGRSVRIRREVMEMVVAGDDPS